VSRHALEGTISVDATGLAANAGPAAGAAEEPTRGGLAETPVLVLARPAAARAAKAAPRREAAPAPRAVEPILPAPEPVPSAPAATFGGPAGGATPAPSGVAPAPGQRLVPVPSGALGTSGAAAGGFGARGAGVGVGAESGRAGSGSASNDEHGPLARYLKGVRERVARHREYPYIARRANLEGTVCLRVAIGASGNVRSVTATCGKTKQPLLAAALDSVSRAAPFPPLPAALGKELTLDVPIVFDLDDL